VWTAVVRADRAWYDEVRRQRGPDVDRVEFPRYCPDRRFVLTGGQVAIGRRSRSRGTNPEIDLSGPPLDPGVSAQHALLVAGPDGGWELVDLDSTNGTSVGGSAQLIAPHTPVRLADGDRIRLGAWTTITVEVARPADGQSR
jgi:pSer/pThr/pTyr-binding forkhead associated (FHA) protein